MQIPGFQEEKRYMSYLWRENWETDRTTKWLVNFWDSDSTTFFWGDYHFTNGPAKKHACLTGHSIVRVPMLPTASLSTIRCAMVDLFDALYYHPQIQHGT